MSDYRLPWFELAAAQVPFAENPDWWFNLLGLDALHKSGVKGQGIRVGVIDTGCDVNHNDLVGAVVDAKDFTRSRLGHLDNVGHGTFCAGEIVARNNGSGIIGVAPESELVVLKGLSDNGSGSSQSMAAAIDYGVQAGCHVLNISAGGPGDDVTIRAACERAARAGVFIVAAAGNSGKNRNGVPLIQPPANYPAAYNGLCVAVAAVDKTGVLAPFSSAGDYVDIASYGVDVLSLAPGGGYKRGSGTSFSAPIVTGVVALLLCRHKQLGDKVKTPIKTNEQLIEHLKRGAKDAGNPGKDTGYGWGLLDPATILAPSEPDVPTPVPTPGDGLTIDLGVLGLKATLPAKAGDLFSIGL